MNRESQMKIVYIICRYYGVDISRFDELLKNREKKFMLLLLLKNSNFFDSNELLDMLGIESVSKMKSTIKRAEEKFLINSFFRKRYIELEEKIKKQID